MQSATLPEIRLLLLDDDEGGISRMNSLLEVEGVRDENGSRRFYVRGVGTMADAAEAIVSDGFDAVLLKFGIDPADQTKPIRILAEIAPETPIIVIGQAGGPDVVMEAIRCGAQDCLDDAKLDSYWLARSIEAAIDRKRAELGNRRIEERLWESQKAESLGVLAAGVAHDFNNLLCGIMGNASMARETVPSNSTAGECLASIEKVSERASLLCRQMLAYSGGRQTLSEEFDLNDLLRGEPELLKTSISKEARLATHVCEEGLPVHGDRSQIGQVIVNLIVNASDALNGLPGTIELKTALIEAEDGFFEDAIMQPEMRPGSYCRISVQDTGMGIDKETMEKMFDPFFTTKFIGRGMGLPAVLGIVRSHQGAIKVRSEEGKGTKVKVYLPYFGSSMPHDTSAPGQSDDWKGSGTILLVDDEEAVRDAALRFLKRMGYTVIEAVDGMEGYERFMASRDNLNAVILDMTMPGMDGGSLCSAIRKVAPEMPVLLMSGYNKSEVMHRVDLDLDLPFMPKPFTFATFRGYVRALLEQPAKAE